MEALKSAAFYVGAIGSKKNNDARRERLQGVRRLGRRDRAPARPGRPVHRLQDAARDRGGDPRRDDRGAPRRERAVAGRRSPSGASIPRPAKSSQDLEHRRPAARGRLRDALRLRQAAPRAAARRADRRAGGAPSASRSCRRVVAVVRPGADELAASLDSRRLRSRRVRERRRRHGREPRLRGARGRRRATATWSRSATCRSCGRTHDRRGARRARRRRAARRAVLPRAARPPGRHRRDDFLQELLALRGDEGREARCSPRNEQRAGQNSGRRSGRASATSTRPRTSRRPLESDVSSAQGGTIVESAQRAVLFADVCDSTTIYESLGDTQALALINRAVRAARHEGRRRTSGNVVKTLGDGMVCQFSGRRRGVPRRLRHADRGRRARARARRQARHQGRLHLRPGGDRGRRRVRRHGQRLRAPGGARPAPTRCSPRSRPSTRSRRACASAAASSIPLKVRGKAERDRRVRRAVARRPRRHRGDLPARAAGRARATGC